MLVLLLREENNSRKLEGCYLIEVEKFWRGENLVQMAQNERFTRRKYQKAEKTILRQFKSTPKFLQL